MRQNRLLSSAATAPAQRSMSEYREMLERAYLAGFAASGEGWNGEYPFEEENPLDDAYWTEIRDEFLAEILAELFAERSKSQGQEQ